MLTHDGRRIPFIGGGDPAATPADIARLFNEFREHNDTRLAEIERHGAASAETAERVDRLNDAISELQARLNRPRATQFGAATQPTDLQLRVYAAWQSTVQRKPVDPNDVDLDLIRNYNRAFNDFMRRGDRAAADSLQVLNEMSVASDPDGGYLVSPDVTGRTAQLVYETSPMRQIASVQNIGTDALEGMNDLDEGAASWVGETASRPDTDTPQIGLWRIPVHEQYAQPRATQKLLDDANVDVEGWLAGKTSSKFSRSENTAFVTGSGVLRPRGFTTYTAGVPSATTWNVIEQVNSGHASQLTANGLIDLVFSLKTAYRAGARFLMNRTTEREVRQLTDGQGNYLWQPDFTQMGASRLLGFPITEFPDLADIAASAEPIAFGDFREGYQIVDRVGIRILRDPYTAKPYVRFYTTKRVGGDVVNYEAIKLQTIAA